ncbi:zinc-binding alcohol dehydrogenase family protein [Promicromonospora sp. AC04]|nr:zinc-binding alcohol dehydrogenase family protein [Promicromonospora sp. AC04]
MHMDETILGVGYRRSLPITDPSSLQDVELPRPVPGPHDLLVEVRAVSVNPVDVKVRAAQDPQGSIKVLGYDAAGVVREVGSQVTLFAPGDEVCYAGSIGRQGTNAALHAVDERIVGRKPAALDFAQAAALPLVAITAWEGLFDKLRITAETQGTLLLVGAPGGVGSMVLQLARELVPGLRVIATASRPEGAEWVRSLGAADVVDHRRGLRGEVERVAPDGVDYIFSMHSSGQVADFVSLLKPFGQVVAIDDPRTLDVRPLKSKSLSWHWELMFARPLHGGADMIRQHELLDQVADLVDGGRIRPIATTVLRPIDAAQLREAHRLVETGRVVGKVVVTSEPA